MKNSASLGLNKNNKGQVALESILLMSVLVFVFLTLSNTIQEKKLLAKLVEKPMTNLKAMTAYGTWSSEGCTAPGKSRQTIDKCHPNSIARSLSSDPN
jgi:hypothetical protein